MALAEMATAGGLGASIRLDAVPRDDDDDPIALLFSESPTRFLLEVAPEDRGRVEAALASWPLGVLGEVVDRPAVQVTGADGATLVDAPLDLLKAAWQRPLRWS